MTRNAQNHSIETFDACRWTRSTYCDPRGGNCLEINGAIDERVAVRDSKPLHAAALMFGPDAWRGFVADIRRGVFDY